MKLAIVATHPIQYQVPWFQGLSHASEVDLRVYYALLPTPEQQGVGFGTAFEWDIPMLEGYTWEALPNTVLEPSLRRFRGSSTPAISARLAEWRPDALVVTGWNALPLLQAYLAALRLRIPRIVRGESNALRPRPAWARLAQRAYLGRFNAALAIGQSNRRFLRERGIRDERIFHAPYFVDNARFEHQAREAFSRREYLRGTWAIPPDTPCFVFAGKLEPKKRLPDLLEGVRIASRAGARLHLLVIGTGELMDEARAFVARHALPVTFGGFLNQGEIARAYAAADCLVLPSDHGETWGLVVNEAMACSRPAIVSDRVGCGPDLVLPEVTGEVFPFGDVAALGGTLARLAADPARLAAMGARAHDHVQSFSVNAAVEGTLAAAEFVCREGSRPRRSIPSHAAPPAVR